MGKVNCPPKFGSCLTMKWKLGLSWPLQKMTAGYLKPKSIEIQACRNILAEVSELGGQGGQLSTFGIFLTMKWRSGLSWHLQKMTPGHPK